MDLNDLRVEIDAVDKELLALFCRRMELSAQIAAVKRQTGRAIRDEKREAEKLLQVAAQVPEELSAEACRLYELLFALSRDYQERQP